MTRLFCKIGRHKNWTGHKATWTKDDEDSFIYNYSDMRCLDCDKIRPGAILKPGESLHVLVEVLVEDVE